VAVTYPTLAAHPDVLARIPVVVGKALPGPGGLIPGLPEDFRGGCRYERNDFV
jgi:hypothetical protein